MIILFIFIFGLCVGSFLGVLIYREAVKEPGSKCQTAGEAKKKRTREAKKGIGLTKYLPSWVWGRSYCDNCKKPIAWHDNIPLLSYFLLKGRCRYCKKKISLQYPLLELMTGIEFVWVYLLVRQNLNFFSQFEGFYSFILLVFWLFLGALMLMILWSDFKYQIIPDSAIMLGVFLALGKYYFTYLYTGYIAWSFIPASLGAFFFFLAIILITGGKGMGFGDAKLAFVMGLLLGFPGILVAIFLAFLTGGLTGVILLLSGKKKLKEAVAFGPFLVFGFFIAQFWGKKILNWYLGLI